MNYLDRIVENILAEAISKGELDNLPGTGEPLQLDDDRLIPEELRMAYRVLRNAGFAPPEVAVLRDIGDLERLLDELPHGDARDRALRKLQVLRTRLEASVRFNHVLAASEPYARQLLERFETEYADVPDSSPAAAGKSD